jgi:hypothetical protein
LPMANARACVGDERKQTTPLHSRVNGVDVSEVLLQKLLIAKSSHRSRAPTPREVRLTFGRTFFLCGGTVERLSEAG